METGAGTEAVVVENHSGWWRRHCRVSFIWIYVLCPVIVFMKDLSFNRVTGWDTFDYFFPRFLYAADCLWSGELPFWNPLQNSGDYFSSDAMFVTNPLNLPFLLLTRLVHPILAFEFSIVAALLLAFVGLRRLLFEMGYKDSGVHVVVVTVFGILMLTPFLGQILFIYSISTLVWILGTVLRIVNNRAGRAEIVASGLLIALMAGMGYIFLNLCSGLIIAAFSVAQLMKKPGIRSRTSFVLDLILFIVPFILLSICLIWPVIEVTRYTYEWFSGDLVSPDPRIRFFPPKITEHIVAIPELLQAMINVFDMTLYKTSIKTWTAGLGIGVTSLLCVRSLSRLPSQGGFRWGQLAWVLGYFYFVGLALGQNTLFGRIFLAPIPFFNNIRYPLITLWLAEFCILMLVIPWLAQIERFQPRVGTKSRVSAYLLLGIIGWSVTRSLTWIPLVLFCLVLDAILFLRIGAKNKKAWAFALLVVGTLVSKAIDGSLHWTRPAKETWKEVSARHQVPVFEGNERLIPLPNAEGPPKELVYDDLRWVLQKKPFTHGYTLFNHPLYARLKNWDGLRNIIVVTDRVEVVPLPTRSSEKGDNVLLDELTNDVLAAGERGRTLVHSPLSFDSGEPLNAQLESVETRPTRVLVNVATNKESLLVNMTKYFPGWTVKVDGEVRPLVRTNYIFSGVMLPAGRHSVEFNFSPLTKWMAFVPYFAFAVAIMLWAASRRSFAKLRRFLSA